MSDRFLISEDGSRVGLADLLEAADRWFRMHSEEGRCVLCKRQTRVSTFPNVKGSVCLRDLRRLFERAADA